ncbi:hypothetical protein C7212DRAFT_281880 [Tuber magnatum]|uniref:Uncharacterized protein n=1 Tax=Tuber magnatum TaxID=42249 RepID=A0A317SKH7_9PEZI|nr:hypothetical protein C7212DRAFT_281880 [Tuber magnatum]
MSRHLDDLERRFGRRLGLADKVKFKQWAIVVVLLTLFFGLILMVRVTTFFRAVLPSSSS